MRILLVFAFVAAAWGQSEKIAFPSDGKDPKDAGGAALLESVCHGHVVVGEEIRCEMPCPKFTGFPDEVEGWRLRAVTKGHFLSPQSDDAVLAMSGCEPGAVNFSGTILLTQRAQKWTMIWYKSGVHTAECHKVRLTTGRETLVCLDAFGRAGIVNTFLTIVDVRAKDPVSDKPLFEVGDNTGTCGQNLDDDLKPAPLDLGRLERVEFVNRSGGVPSIQVTYATGKSEMTPDGVDACINEQRSGKPSTFLPRATTRQTEFRFANGTYREVGIGKR